MCEVPPHAPYITSRTRGTPTRSAYHVTQTCLIFHCRLLQLSCPTHRMPKKIPLDDVVELRRSKRIQTTRQVQMDRSMAQELARELAVVSPPMPALEPMPEPCNSRWEPRLDDLEARVDQALNQSRAHRVQIDEMEAKQQEQWNDDETEDEMEWHALPSAVYSPTPGDYSPAPYSLPPVYSPTPGSYSPAPADATVHTNAMPPPYNLTEQPHTRTSTCSACDTTHQTILQTLQSCVAF